MPRTLRMETRSVFVVHVGCVFMNVSQPISSVFPWLVHQNRPISVIQHLSVVLKIVLAFR